jgi:hypothetical protein
VAWLQAGQEFRFASLYLIGESEDPASVWLTDWDTPLAWPVWSDEKRSTGVPKAFDPAVITRGSVASKLGLEVDHLSIKWSPGPPTAPAQSIALATPYELARVGFYDNKPVRVWTAYMPAEGDANTFGASELFGGRIADTTIERGVVTFTVNSFLDVVNQSVPTNVVELTSTLANYKGAIPPTGFNSIPHFTVISAGGNTIIGDCISPAHHVFATNAFQLGYLVFDPGSTLAGLWSAIQTNFDQLVGSTHYSGFVIYTPMAWPPTPGDTFYVSAAAPQIGVDSFPFIPASPGF